jgi:hypothetical protein
LTGSAAAMRTQGAEEIRPRSFPRSGSAGKEPADTFPAADPFPVVSSPPDPPQRTKAVGRDSSPSCAGRPEHRPRATARNSVAGSGAACPAGRLARLVVRQTKPADPGAGAKARGCTPGRRRSTARDRPDGCPATIGTRPRRRSTRPAANLGRESVSRGFLAGLYTSRKNGCTYNRPLQFLHCCTLNKGRGKKARKA